MPEKKPRLRLLALAAILSLCASPVVAQDDDVRPAGVTFLGDTGLWFVPTAEIVGDGQVAASGHVATFNRQQGFTAIQSMAGTFAIGIRDRVEVFGSVPFLTRIDRDVRPLFRPHDPPVGGVLPDFPFVTDPFSGNAMGDVVVGAKVNLLTERTQAPFAFAVRGWGRLPTGDEDAGTTAGAPGGAIGLVMSKNLGEAEISANADVLLRGDPSGIDVPHGLLWGIGIGAPVRGRLRIFGELLGQGVLGGAMTLTEPLVAADGSMSGLASSDRRPIDAVVGAQVQGGRFAAGAGLTLAVRHVDRATAGQSASSTDRLGFLVRMSYHPGVRVYTPPPPPPPPPPAPPANRPPTVIASCDPCEVEFGDEVRLRADASDPDGDPLDFRWSTPAGRFLDASDRATTRWQAPEQEGPVPLNVSVADDRGGMVSDTATVLVNAPPAPPRREFVFEDLHFDFDRYSLRGGAARVLDEVVAALAEDPALRIQIEGHTCNIGTNEYNLALGDRRATSVQEYLTARGVEATRLQTISYGEERPAHDNSREETRRLNRRAALVVRMQ